MANTEATVRGHIYRTTCTHYPDSDPISFCSFSLKFIYRWQNIKKKFTIYYQISNTVFTMLETERSYIVHGFEYNPN
jgi:hypothetical protein